MNPRATLSLALLALGCGDPPPVTVVAARDLGTLETSAVIRGRDGGYSGRFRGRSVWLYGDTILARAGEDGSSWRHNTASWTTDADASDGITGFREGVDARGAPREFFPQTDDERAYNARHAGERCAEAPCGARRVLWPGPLVEDPARGRALVFYVKIHGEPGPWNFHGLGCGVAVWADPDAAPARPVVRPGTDEPTLLWTAAQGFCASAAYAEGETLYAWSCVANPGKPCHLGRVPLDRVTDPAAWRYWAGDGVWHEDLARADAVFDGNDMTTVHWNAHLGLLVAVYSAPLDDDIMLRTAPRPEGPWSDAVVLATARAPVGEGSAYSGLAHAEFQRGGGRYEYVTYYRGTGDWSGEVRVLEVELARR